MVKSNVVKITVAGGTASLQASTTGFQNVGLGTSCEVLDGSTVYHGLNYDAEVTVSASGGVPPYTYTVTWKGGSIGGETQSNSTGSFKTQFCSAFYGLVTGGTAKVTDSVGHTASATF